MATSADTTIASLESFAARDDGGDEETLYRIVEAFEELPDRLRVLPAMFAVMERYPEADLGSPGPLVHSIERIPVAEYEPFLRASVECQPGQLNVWMVNRILNSQLSEQQREQLLALLKRVTSHPRALETTRQTAERFLKHQAERQAR
jgi:hypothetical protein